MRRDSKKTSPIQKVKHLGDAVTKQLHVLSQTKLTFQHINRTVQNCTNILAHVQLLILIENQQERKSIAAKQPSV